MNVPSPGLSVRAGLLILASWIAVGALSGNAVYRSMRHAPGDDGSAWEDGEGAALVTDPSGATVQEDLAHGPPRTTAEREKAAHLAKDAEGRAPTASAANATNEDGTPRKPASAEPGIRQTPEEKAEAEKAVRAARRELFQTMLSGTTSWTGLTPEILSALTTEDIAAGLAQVDAMPWGPEANRALQGLLRRWGEMDPRAAADYALGLDSNRAGSTAVRAIWNEWAERDPASAIDWYFSHLKEEPAKLTPSLRVAFMRLAALDPARALATAWQMPEAMGREALRAIVSQAALDGGLEGLRTVVAGMSPGSQRNQMISAIIQEYSVYQPAEAVRWINMMDDAGARSYAVNQLVAVWGYDRPAEAAQWVRDLPDHTLLGRSAATLMRSWSASEPEEAAAWLRQMPAALYMDAAVESYIRNTMVDDPAGAMAFVERLTDPKRRRALVLSVGKLWASQSPDQARAYFQASTWDASVRNRFL